MVNQIDAVDFLLSEHVVKMRDHPKDLVRIRDYLNW
jgi:hypothetical protein